MTTNIDFVNEDLVQAVEQIIDEGTISVQRVWDKDSDEDSHMLFSSSMMDDLSPMDPEDEETSMTAWLEAMVAVCEEYDMVFNNFSIDNILKAINHSDTLLDLLEEDSVEKVALKLSLEVSEECFSGANITLTYSVFKKDSEDVLAEIVLMDLFAYAT